MPTLARGMQFTEWEWAYILWHLGWRPAPIPTPLNAPSMWVRMGLDGLESQRNSGAYLQRKENTAGGPSDDTQHLGKCVGYDIGPHMFNERLGPASVLPDAFALFDWWESVKFGFEFSTVTSPGNPFWPWAAPRYPNASRNDTTLDVVGIADRVGPNPYAIERSPFWRMVANGVPTHDLEQPPRELWVSPLPEAGLHVGQQGTSTSPLGIAINTLQRRLALEGHWVTKTGAPAGAFNWYYGLDWVTSSLASKQRQLASLGLYSGVIDGRTFTPEFRAIWDGALRHAQEIGV